MAQQLAFTMVQSADWASRLTGGPTLLGNTSIGAEWSFNHQSAQNDVLAAVAKLGRLVALWRKKDQVRCRWWRLPALIPFLKISTARSVKAALPGTCQHNCRHICHHPARRLFASKFTCNLCWKASFKVVHLLDSLFSSQHVSYLLTELLTTNTGSEGQGSREGQREDIESDGPHAGTAARFRGAAGVHPVRPAHRQAQSQSGQAKYCSPAQSSFEY